MKATSHGMKRRMASRATRRDRAAPLPSLNEHRYVDVIVEEGDAVAVVMGIISHRPRADRDTVRGTCLAHRVCTPMSHNGYGTQAPRGVPSKSEGEETPCNRYHYVLYLNRLTGMHCGGQDVAAAADETAEPGNISTLAPAEKPLDVSDAFVHFDTVGCFKS